MASKMLPVGLGAAAGLVLGVTLPALAGPLAASKDAGAWPDDVAALVHQQLGLSVFSLQDIRVPADITGGFAVGIELNGQAQEVGLVPYSVRAADLRVLVQGADGSFTSVEAPPVATVRGDIAMVPGSRARGSVALGGL